MPWRFSAQLYAVKNIELMPEIQITDANRDAIMSGNMCPYCGCPTKYVDSIRVYKVRSYGMVYVCFNCDAWVGTHKSSTRALGRLANAELRLWKRMAHDAFDPIWKAQEAAGTPKYIARTEIYKWLSGAMGIDPRYTHIGMFGVEQCRAVIELCKHYNPIL